MFFTRFSTCCSSSIIGYRATVSHSTAFRTITTAATKRGGTIADAFASLSGQDWKPLEPRFSMIKQNLIKGNEEAIKASWIRLLARLRDETAIVTQATSSIVPEIRFCEINSAPSTFQQEFKKRGAAVIRGVVPEHEALQMKADLKTYIAMNPQTKAYPPDDPQVWELYWSPSQARARAHPNLLQTQEFLMSFWHSKDPNALVSTQPVAYADRLRMRQPGDAKFALGPHVDGGSCERWEAEGYGRGKVYEKIWQGKWEEFDPWESSCRLPVVSDLYQGAGACSAFRMAQGWLSMSEVGPFEGTLLVNPLLGVATAYYLLRPFFTAIGEPRTRASTEAESFDEEYLRPENWKMEDPLSSWVQGANPGSGMELRHPLHPHLDLANTMVHVPTVKPGDYVAWHCDTIHAVDKVHTGKSDSSVMYIPACPLTELNAHYLKKQRDCFIGGVPSPDFPGGIGESEHRGRPHTEDLVAMSNDVGARAMGLREWKPSDTASPGESEVMSRANKILGFV